MVIRVTFLLGLFLVGCAAAKPSEPKTPPAYQYSVLEIAYNCSNNARLCSAFIADLNSKSLEQIKFFLVCEHSAWSGTAAALTSCQ